MATRKFLFFNADEGFPEEQQSGDELLVGKITLGGVSGVGLDLGTARIVNVAYPTADTDAATKAYVDATATGLDWKNSVKALGSSNVTLSGSQVVDAVSLNVGDRVLLTGQSTPSQNGIWVVAAGAWARAPDADASNEVNAGLAVFIESGSTYSDTGWVLTTTGAVTLGTTPLTFSQFTGAASLVAGAGMQKSGSQLDLELDAFAGAQTTGTGGASGLEFDVSGVDGKLRAAVLPSGGLIRASGGLSTLLNGTTLQSNSSGLSVKGLPSTFEINGQATSGNVTAPNLGTLTAGGTSDAAALHFHSKAVTYWTAQATITKGNACYISSSDQISPGNNTTDASSRVMGLADANIAASASGPIVINGVITGILTGATANTPYYLGPSGAPIVYSAVASGSRVVRIGFAKNSTDLVVRIMDFGKKA